MLDRPPAWTEEKSASPDRAGGAMAMVLSAKADANDGVRMELPKFASILRGVGACRVAHLVQVSASQVGVVVIALIAAPPEGERCAAARRGKRLATAPADAMVICTRLVDVRWRLARL